MDINHSFLNLKKIVVIRRKSAKLKFLSMPWKCHQQQKGYTTYPQRLTLLMEINYSGAQTCDNDIILQYLQVRLCFIPRMSCITDKVNPRTLETSSFPLAPAAQNSPHIWTAVTLAEISLFFMPHECYLEEVDFSDERFFGGLGFCPVVDSDN